MRSAGLWVLGLLLVGVEACGDDAVTNGASTTATTATTGAGGAAAATTSVASTSSGAGGQKPMGPGPGEPCDALKQDCADPSAPKCFADPTTDPVAVPSTCGPQYGSDGVGDSCTRPTNETGIDTCAPGLYCSPVGAPLGTPTKRLCAKLCSEDSECPTNQICGRFNTPAANTSLPPDTRLIGGCFPVCQVWDPSTCPTGTKCLIDVDTNGGATYNCFGFGTGMNGQACTANADCGQLLGCNTVTHVCQAFCDNTHPCATHQSCQASSDGTPPRAGVTGLCGGPPSAWTCSASSWADGVSCDCNCGAVDPDCSNATLPVVGCAVTQGCVAGACQ